MNDETSPPATPAARDDTVLDWARAAGAGDLLAGGLDRYLQRRRRKRLALASAAMAVLLVAGAIGLRTHEAASAARASATVLRPEQRTLPDGSTVDLNAGAEIAVAFTDSIRRVELRKGEAHFQVARNPQRPFIVSAGTIEVRAVGTAFAVELGTSAVDVLVTEGHVAVNNAAPSTASATTASSAVVAPPLAALGAGGHIVIGRQASSAAAPVVSELSAADINTRLAWRVPRLKFAATPLAQVVAMFNEHAVAGRDARLVLAPDVPASLRVSGTLRADDVDSLLTLLAGEFGISGESQAGKIILRRK